MEQVGDRGVVRLPADPDVVSSRRIALIIGIDQYEAEIGDLRYAVKDAAELTKVLRATFGFEVILLQNEQATRGRIQQAISQLRDRTSPDDQLFFFFAGHGVSFNGHYGEITFLLAHDARGNDHEAAWSSGLSIRDLREQLLQLPPRHILMAFDACFAGHAAEPSQISLEPAHGTLPPKGTLVSVLTHHPARQIITAGIVGQQVIESEAWRHSAFTKALLDGLNIGEADLNDDGVIPATELFSYVQEVVTVMTRGRQTPDYRKLTGDVGEFVFVLPSAPVNDEGDAPSPSSNRYPIDTPRSIHRPAPKLIIIRPEASLFPSETGQPERKLRFQQVVFLHKVVNRKAAITFRPLATAPDGWLEAGTFSQWVTSRILELDPQRTPAIRLYENRRCARLSARMGDMPGCRSELFKTGSSTYQSESIYMPVLEEDGEVAKIGFLKANSPPPSLVKDLPYSSGWLSLRKIEDLGLVPRALLTRSEARRLANVLELFSWAIGGEADERRYPLPDLKRVLALVFDIDSHALFEGNSSLGNTLERRGTLPFQSDLLDVTFSELESWSAEDRDAFGALLGERAAELRKLLGTSRPGIRVGDVFYIFIPSRTLE